MKSILVMLFAAAILLLCLQKISHNKLQQNCKQKNTATKKQPDEDIDDEIFQLRFTFLLKAPP